MLQALTHYSILWSRSVTVLYTIPQKVVSKCHRFPHIIPKMIRNPYISPHESPGHCYSELGICKTKGGRSLHNGSGNHTNEG